MRALTPDAGILGDPEAPAIIAVSGGRDSMALLHCLFHRGFRRLVVCHFDHGWRAESTADAEFVLAAAKSYDLECRVKRGEPGQRTEAAAREARYTFLAQAAAATRCHRIFLAHQADDQVETFLFNLLRGAAGPGLGGMQPVSRRVIGSIEVELVRPFLGCWREEIDAYVDKFQLRFVDDASNHDVRFTRNRLRHEVLPALAAAMGRPVRGALWKAAAVLSAENEFLAAQPELREIPAELPVKALRALPVALQRRMIHAWLNRQGVEEVGFDEVEAVRRFLGQRSPAKVNLARGRHARRREGKIFVDG